VFKKVWNWLNGKKTVIGSVLLFGAQFLKPHTVAYQIAFYGGTFLAGGGAAHKVKKGELSPKGKRLPDVKKADEWEKAVKDVKRDPSSEFSDYEINGW